MRLARLCSLGVILGAAASIAEAAAPCRATPPPTLTAAGLAADLSVSQGASELRARPALVGRLRETPHNYFRFVNHAFSAAVCRQFDDVRGSLPEVSLHGDAHVEQYAITSLGHGLSDFDDSARGPYVVDLVRFGVSLELAARARGWGGADGAVDDFLRGYYDALQDPTLERPPRRTIGRARAAFAFDHDRALRRAGALMASHSVAPSELQAHFRTYIDRVRARTPAVPASFFRIKQAGRLELGIGSALDEKYLLRIEGWTEDGSDDQILEAKSVDALADAGCVHADGPERVSLGMSMIARRSFPFAGLMARGGGVLSIHGWTDDYVELKIDSSFTELRDLQQVAYDVGTQLGRAHPKLVPGIAATHGDRTRLLESARTHAGRILGAIDELTEATVEAWWAFRREVRAGF